MDTTKPQPDLQALALTKAIRATESGGNYSATGDAGTSTGAYQYQPNTWKQYSKEVLGVDNAPMTPENQNAVTYGKIKTWKDSGMGPAEIAAAWNAGEGKAKSGAWTSNIGVNKINGVDVPYNTPEYAQKVVSSFKQLYPQVQQQYGGQVSQVTQPTEQPAPEKSFLRKVGDFFTGGTQKFGTTIGESLAAPANADLYNQALEGYTTVENNLKDAIRKVNQNGGDPSKLQSVLASHEASKPKIEDFTGNVINKTGEQVLGEGAMAGMEALSGGILSGGAKAIASKGLMGGLTQGAKIGAAYGAIGGGASAMQENADLAGVVGGTAVGGAVGGVLGAGLSGAGILAGKVGSAINKTGIVNKIMPQTEARLAKQTEWVSQAESNIVKEAERALPLTPTQKMKEAQNLAKTGSNLYTTLADMAKYGVHIGDENAISNLQKVSDQFENAINYAKTNEHGRFNVTEIRNNAYKTINENLTSSTERTAAKLKIDKEINAILGEKGVEKINVGGNTYTNSDIVERLRMTGNDWAQYNALNPDSVKNATGRALANSVRDQVEKEGTFPAYRTANKEWGKVIHAQEMLQKMEDQGKQLKDLKGLFGPLTRRLVSAGVGLQTGGVGHIILNELGSEYAARIFSNPEVRTYFDQKIIERFANGKATPEAIAQLEKEIKAHLDEVAMRGTFKALPAPSALGTERNPIITPAPTTFEAPAKQIRNESQNIKAPNVETSSKNANPTVGKTVDLVSEAKKYKSGKDFYELSGGKINQSLRDKGIRGQEQVTKYWEEVTGKKSVNGYSMSHRPSESGSGFDITDAGLMPKDFYLKPENYLAGNEVAGKESIIALLKIKGKPNAEITVYRASPKNELNNGDWISLSKTYANGESLSEGTKVYSFKVKAKDIQFAGDDINEFGYFPKK